MNSQLGSSGHEFLLRMKPWNKKGRTPQPPPKKTPKTKDRHVGGFARLKAGS